MNYKFNPKGAQFKITIRDRKQILYFDEGTAIALVVKKELPPRGVANAICTLATTQDKLMMAGDLMESALKDCMEIRPIPLNRKAREVSETLKTLSDRIIEKLYEMEEG